MEASCSSALVNLADYRSSAVGSKPSWLPYKAGWPDPFWLPQEDDRRCLNMRYGTYSIGGRKFGTKAISISCRVVSERTTFGTMKMAIELSREKPTPPRSHRYTKIDRAFASSSTITRSTPPARGFGSRSNGLPDPKTGEAR